VVVDSPSAEGVHYSTLPVTLQATANDGEDLPSDLRVSWTVDDGEVLVEGVEPDSTGLSTTSHTFEAGTYGLVVTATDTGGKTAPRTSLSIATSRTRLAGVWAMGCAAMGSSSVQPSISFIV
jgi:hypothetical protein